MTGVMTKAPGDRLDYDVEFFRWLTDGDTIQSAGATIENSAAIIDEVEFSEHGAKVWVSGGADGETAHVTLTISTAQGRTKAYCFRLRIRDC